MRFSFNFIHETQFLQSKDATKIISQIIPPRRSRAAAMRFIPVILMLFTLSTFAQQKPEGLFLNAKAPDFKAVDQNNSSLRLKDLTKKGKVVLVFYRGYWCPYCNRHLQELEDSLSLIKEKGATLIAITPESIESIDKTVEKTHASYSIISDKGRKIMKSYGVEYELEESKKARYKKLKIDLSEINADNSFFLPIPATYIIDKEMKIIYRYFDADYKKRPSISNILEKL